MKRLLIILTCILYQTTFGQFGIIADKDGFVNVRKSPNISNNIIDTLNNGQIVYCFEDENGWLPVDYNLTGEKFKSGYIHKSRIIFIENFDSIAYYNLNDSTIIFKKDSIKLTISKTKFNSKDNKLEYHKSDSSKNEMSYLEKINGKKIWGTDGDIPKKQYNQITLTLGNEIIQLPFDNLFEPSLDDTTVNVDKNNSTIYITAMNGDGAGSYVVLWIIENGKFKQRIITYPF